MQQRPIDPRSIHVTLWNLARSYRVLHTGSLNDRRANDWPLDDIRVLDDLIARHFPDRDPEDIFSALHFAIRARAILDNYDRHLSFVDDAEVFLQSTTDGERVYTVDFGVPDVLPNYYFIIPLAYVGEKFVQGNMPLISDLENDLKGLPSKPAIQWREQLLPAQPFAGLRNEMYNAGGYIYTGWMLPSEMTASDIEIVRKETLFIKLIKMLTDSDPSTTPGADYRNS